MTDYLELVDLTGRATRRGKRGSIDASQAAILFRLGIQSEEWIQATNNVETDFNRWVESTQSIEKLTDQQGIRYIRNQSECRRVFG